MNTQVTVSNGASVLEQVIVKGNLGDTESGRKAGFKNRARVIWSACRICGFERWVPLKNFGNECRSCSGKRTIRSAQEKCPSVRPWQSENQRGDKNPSWKGGKVKGGNGYIYVLLAENDPLFCMANKTKYVMEHRLNMARHLGRPLEKWEQVHHLNGIRTDNKIENLELWKLSQPAGVRQADYHCPGCRCHEIQ